MTIRPKNYDEVVRLKRCLLLKQYVPEIDEQLFQKIFDFLSEDAANKVSAAKGMLSFTNKDGQTVFSKALNFFDQKQYTLIEVTALTLSVLRPYTSSSAGDGGTSGNNNNNNNNNNNG